MMLGRLLGLSAILLQIAVFLQPLLPEKHRVSSVCETIVQALDQDYSVAPNKDAATSTHSYSHHHFMSDDMSVPGHSQHHLDVILNRQNQDSNHGNHACLFCLVYSHIVPLLDTAPQYVPAKIWTLGFPFIDSFFHTSFKLGQLFFIPQGRAPPLYLFAQQTGYLFTYLR